MVERVKGSLQKNFCVAVLVAVFHVFLGWFLSEKWKESGVVYNTNALKTIVILFVLISIPITLKLFNSYLKKISRIESNEQKEQKYILACRLRLLMILIGLISAIMCYFLVGVRDMIYIVSIEVVVLILCIPTEKRIRGEIDVFETEIKD